MPPFPTQLQVILLRQMLLIDEQGELVRTPLVESIQLRVGQMDAQFNLSRNHLFAGKSGGLRPLDGEEQGFPIFQTVGFEHFFEGQTEPSVSLPPVTLNQCTVCHRFGPHPISVNFSRFNFGMQSEERIVVRATSPEREAAFTIAWKEAHESWLRLQALPAASPPAIDSADGDGITVGIPELDALLPILLRDELPLEHIQFTSLPCTHQPGLGGPPKCEESEAEGTLIAVLPIMAQSGSYLRRSQIDGLILNVVRVDTVYRVANSTPWDGWPPGDYGIIAENADGFPPAITVFVADGKIVRLTYHMGKLLDTVRAEVTGEILYPADALPP